MSHASHPSIRAVARRQSLRWRLPLSISAVIAIVLAAFLWAAYREVEATLIRAGGDREQNAAGQLVALLERSLQQSIDELRRTAADPDVLAFLQNPSDAAREAAVRARLSQRTGTAARRVELWNAAGARVFEIALPARDPSGAARTSVAAPPPLDASPSSVGIGDLQVAAGSVFTSAVAEIVNPSAAGRSRAGYLVHRSRLALNPSNALGRLIGGQDARLLLGNKSGSVWTDLSAIVPPPPVDVTQAGLKQYRGADGRQWVGSGAEIRGTPWMLWVELPRATVTAPARLFLRRMLLIAALVVLIAAMVVRLVTRRMTTPMTELTQAAESIASGDYARRVTIDRRDEIGRLAAAFNTMGAEIEDGRRRLEAQVLERTQALEALGRSEAHHRAIVEVAFDCVISADTAGRIVEFNPAAEKTFGYRRADVLGRDMAEIIIPPSLREAHRAGLARFAATGEGRLLGRLIEMTACRSDGTEFPVELAITAIRSGDQPMLTGVIRDLTQRKQAEHKRLALEEQLGQAQRMEAIGRLAGGVAHDFNNLLTAILGYSEFALEQVGPSHPVRPDLEEIRKAGESASSLTRQLLAFSRRQLLQPEIVDLNDVVKRMDTLLRRLIGEDIALASRLTPELDPVNVDPGQAEQIVLNMAVNARDAMKSGGLLTIETGNVWLDESYVSGHPDAMVGPHVMIAVSDTGAGMSAATMEHVFEPFFTTKPRGEGTGLGLATVYGIVKQSGGSIWVYSEVGRGTTFKVYFPRAAAEGSPRVSTRAKPAAVGGSETILVAEDQAEVRSLAREVLTRNGYTVLEAASGQEALRLIHDTPGPIHLLLTDVIMPVMSGRELVGEVQRLRPEIRVLYASGYTDDAIVRHGMLDPGVAFLQKPFTPRSLLLKIREVLDLHPPTPAPAT